VDVTYFEKKTKLLESSTNTEESYPEIHKEIQMLQSTSEDLKDKINDNNQLIIFQLEGYKERESKTLETIKILEEKEQSFLSKIESLKEEKKKLEIEQSKGEDFNKELKKLLGSSDQTIFDENIISKLNEIQVKSEMKIEMMEKQILEFQTERTENSAKSERLNQELYSSLNIIENQKRELEKNSLTKFLNKKKKSFWMKKKDI